MRYVPDTNVVVSGVLFPASKPGLLLDLSLSRAISCVASHELVEEWRAVLKRPKFGFEAAAVDGLVDCLEAVCLQVVPLPQSRWLSPDPKDQFVVDLAAAAQAAIITGNARHFEAYPWVLSPAEAIEEIRGSFS